MKRRTTASPWETVRDLARALPGMEEGTCYGTPAFRVRRRLVVRLREDGETMVLKTDFLERDVLMHMEPETFFLTDHYRDYPWVLVRLPRVGRGRLRDLLEQAWRRVAPKRPATARARRRSR